MTLQVDAALHLYASDFATRAFYHDLDVSCRESEKLLNRLAFAFKLARLPNCFVSCRETSVISGRTFSIVLAASFLALLTATLAPTIQTANRSWHSLVCNGAACPQPSPDTARAGRIPKTRETTYKNKAHRV
jgi:hypothetical protein